MFVYESKNMRKFLALNEYFIECELANGCAAM